MRWKVPTCVLLVLAILFPAASATAQSGSDQPKTTACSTVVYKDLRQRVTIDLDAASDGQVRLLANQIMAASTADALTTMPDKMQEMLDGTANDLRAFLRNDLYDVWSLDLRIAVTNTMTNAGPGVHAAALKTLDTGTIDAYLAYLNSGMCVARALDSASQSAVSASSESPAASRDTNATGVPANTVSPSSGSATLAVTGSRVGLVAVVGLTLIVLGGATAVLMRRRRIRFVSEG